MQTTKKETIKRDRAFCRAFCVGLNNTSAVDTEYTNENENRSFKTITGKRRIELLTILFSSLTSLRDRSHIVHNLEVVLSFVP